MSAARAASIGLVDEVGPRHPEAYGEWLDRPRRTGERRAEARSRRQAKAKRLAAERVPLEVYEARELAEMSRDMYGDRSGFAAARSAFVRKARPAETPARLRATPVAPPATRQRATNERRPATTLRPAIPMSA